MQVGPQIAGEAAGAIKVAQGRRPSLRAPVVSEYQDVVRLEVAVCDGHLAHPVHGMHDIDEQPQSIPLGHPSKGRPHHHIKHVARRLFHYDVCRLTKLHPVRVSGCVVWHESIQASECLGEADLLLELINLLLALGNDLLDSNLQAVLEKTRIDNAGIAFTNLLAPLQLFRSPFFRHAVRRQVLDHLRSLRGNLGGRLLRTLPDLPAKPREETCM
mmetsp:Transcript_71940/g.208395  ORF Transcript_71940/g.208395 Transcript_71940/m.208395 type:complete len:215 (-) Transcript_71940:1141-1785(-)